MATEKVMEKIDTLFCLILSKQVPLLKGKGGSSTLYPEIKGKKKQGMVVGEVILCGFNKINDNTSNFHNDGCLKNLTNLEDK